MPLDVTITISITNGELGGSIEEPEVTVTGREVDIAPPGLEDEQESIPPLPEISGDLGELVVDIEPPLAVDEVDTSVPAPGLPPN